MVRVLYYSASGKRKKSLRAGRETARGRGGRDKLPTTASYDGKSATKALGMVGGKDSQVEGWQCGAPNNVPSKHGHQDGVR